MSLDPNALEQLLFVDPGRAFVAVDMALRGLGWTPDGRAPTSPPLIPGEPELFGWSWDGGRPRVLMGFNPVARLRSLDVGEVPPELRGAIAQALPLVGVPEALAWLGAPEPRARLRGLWLLREGEHIGEIAAVARLLEDPVPEVAAAAAGVKLRLEQLRELRIRVKVGLSTLVSRARPVLATLRDREALEALKPQEGDMDQIFAPEVAMIAEAYYAELWRELPELEPGQLQQAHGAVAGMFRGPNEHAAPFPGGYRRVAGWLRPERAWVCWSELCEGRRMRRDGLVLLGERWIWLPRPWRAVGELPNPR